MNWKRLWKIKKQTYNKLSNNNILGPIHEAWINFKLV